MSDILIAEGFGYLKDGSHVVGTDREILGSQWTAYSSNLSIEDRADGRKWFKGTNGWFALTSDTFADQTEFAISFLVKPPGTYGGAHDQLFDFYDGADRLGFIGITSAGVLQYTGGSTQTLSGALPVSTETHVEVRILLHNSTGWLKSWINGVLYTEITGIDTLENGSALDSMVLNYLRSNWLVGDIALHTMTSPLGAPGVYYLPAASDGTDTDFTPSAGTDHFAMVDEVGPDEDTTYNESAGTSLHRDSYLTAGITGLTVLSVSPLIRARKTDTGTSSIKVGLRHSATEGQGAAIGLSEDYLTYMEWMDTNPSTSAAWAAAAIAATEATVQVQ